jgi:phosphoglycolate phosphatase
MIGDRQHDIIGAKEVGISSIGVLFGYGDRSELEKAGADFIADTVADIGKIFIRISVSKNRPLTPSLFAKI